MLLSTSEDVLQVPNITRPKNCMVWMSCSKIVRMGAMFKYSEEGGNAVVTWQLQDVMTIHLKYQDRE